MKLRTSNNGIFFFRESKDGTKADFLKLLEKLPFEYNEAGNIAVRDFIKKYNKRINKAGQTLKVALITLLAFTPAFIAALFTY